jgi:hypothetical protein
MAFSSTNFSLSLAVAWLTSTRVVTHDSVKLKVCRTFCDGAKPLPCESAALNGESFAARL